MATNIAAKAAHTPGPWNIFDDGHGYMTIAQTREGAWTHGFICDDIGIPANAKLIAAAPELLKSALIEEAFDALGYTVAALDWLAARGVEVDKVRTYQPGDYAALRNESRRAAIAKAEGR